MGIAELNENAQNYFAEIEQAAFAPAHIVDGIGYSPDKMLQGRILGYTDAQRYRLGANYEQSPVNRCPFAVNNYQRDGHMRVDGNAGKEVNYYPNSFSDVRLDPSYTRPAEPLEGKVAEWFDRNGPREDDHYTQPGIFYREVMDEAGMLHLIENIVGAMSGISGSKRNEIINRQL